MKSAIGCAVLLNPKTFAGPDTRVIAQANHAEELRKYRLLLGYNAMLNIVQWGAHVPREQRGASLGVACR